MFYTILHSPDPSELEYQVNHVGKKGYLPHGSLIVKATMGKSGVIQYLYIQAMIFNETKSPTGTQEK